MSGHSTFAGEWSDLRERLEVRRRYFPIETLTQMDGLSVRQIASIGTRPKADAKRLLSGLAQKLDQISIHEQRNCAYANLYFGLAFWMIDTNRVHGGLEGCDYLIARYLDRFFSNAAEAGSFPSMTSDDGMVPALVMTGHCVPLYFCHAEITTIPKRLLVDVARNDFTKLLLALMQQGGFGPVLALHAPKQRDRHLTPEALREDYRLAAGIVNHNSSVLGTFGCAWYMDPQLQSISPHLGMLGNLFESGGAVIVNMGSNADAIQDALWKSRTRQKLYEQGLYRPTRYARVWPRASLVRWAGTCPELESPDIT